MLTRVTEFLTTWSKLLTAIGIIVGTTITVYLYTVDPMLKWIDENHKTQEYILEELKKNTEDTKELRADVLRLINNRDIDDSPAVVFGTRGHTVSAAKIGGQVVFNFSIKVLRDCGPPRMTVVFRNGSEIVHQFENNSFLSNENLGPSFRVNKEEYQNLRFVAKIPDDQGVKVTGQEYAYAWIEIDFPDQCPLVKPVISQEIPFEITE